MSVFSAVARTPELQQLVPQLMLPCMHQPPPGRQVPEYIQVLLTYTHGRLHDRIACRHDALKPAAVVTEAQALHARAPGLSAQTAGLSGVSVMERAVTSLQQLVATLPLAQGEAGDSLEVLPGVRSTLDAQVMVMTSLQQLGDCARGLASAARQDWRTYSRAEQQAVKEAVEGLLKQLATAGSATSQLMQELRGLVASLQE